MVAEIIVGIATPEDELPVAPDIEIYFAEQGSVLAGDAGFGCACSSRDNRLKDARGGGVAGIDILFKIERADDIGTPFRGRRGDTEFLRKLVLVRLGWRGECQLQRVLG